MNFALLPKIAFHYAFCADAFPRLPLTFANVMKSRRPNGPSHFSSSVSLWVIELTQSLQRCPKNVRCARSTSWEGVLKHLESNKNPCFVAEHLDVAAESTFNVSQQQFPRHPVNAVPRFAGIRVSAQPSLVLWWGVVSQFNPHTDVFLMREEVLIMEITCSKCGLNWIGDNETVSKCRISTTCYLTGLIILCIKPTLFTGAAKLLW